MSLTFTDTASKAYEHKTFTAAKIAEVINPASKIQATKLLVMKIKNIQKEQKRVWGIDEETYKTINDSLNSLMRQYKQCETELKACQQEEIDVLNTRREAPQKKAQLQHEQQARRRDAENTRQEIQLQKQKINTQTEDCKQKRQILEHSQAELNELGQQPKEKNKRQKWDQKKAKLLQEKSRAQDNLNKAEAILLKELEKSDKLKTKLRTIEDDLEKLQQQIDSIDTISSEKGLAIIDGVTQKQVETHNKLSQIRTEIEQKVDTFVQTYIEENLRDSVRSCMLDIFTYKDLKNELSTVI